jgi:hypothetical protein
MPRTFRPRKPSADVLPDDMPYYAEGEEVVVRTTSTTVDAPVLVDDGPSPALWLLVGLGALVVAFLIYLAAREDDEGTVSPTPTPSPVVTTVIVPGQAPPPVIIQQPPVIIQQAPPQQTTQPTPAPTSS